MIEFAWSGGELFYRERSFQVDAAGAFCGVTEFGEWKKVPTLHEFPPQENNEPHPYDSDAPRLWS